MTQKNTNDVVDPELLRQITVKLTEEGKLMEAGWAGLRLACGLMDAPPDQLKEMRQAFFAGGQHLFSSIMNVLDSDREPTMADLQRMSAIADELEAFDVAFRQEHGLPER